MPEGPTIVILKDEVSHFAGKKILDVYGNSKIDQARLVNKTVIAVKSWGKHFLLCFKGFTLRIHFLMFGSYTVNDQKPGRAIRLGLKFKNGEINFYTCSVKFIEGALDEQYDWSVDVMNPGWNASKAKIKSTARGNGLRCIIGTGYFCRRRKHH